MNQTSAYDVAKYFGDGFKTNHKMLAIYNMCKECEELRIQVTGLKNRVMFMQEKNAKRNLDVKSCEEDFSEKLNEAIQEAKRCLG